MFNGHGVTWANEVEMLNIQSKGWHRQVEIQQRKEWARELVPCPYPGLVKVRHLNRPLRFHSAATRNALGGSLPFASDGGLTFIGDYMYAVE